MVKTSNAIKKEKIMKSDQDNTAYLDIETSFAGYITIIGIYLPINTNSIQLIRPDISSFNLLEILNDNNVGVIKTYNGERFDLPVIKKQLGIDLSALYFHYDVMYLCWQNNLKGGLKAVEKQLGILRETQGVDGVEAMKLWEAWESKADKSALDLLLKYNREDIELLVKVEEILLKKSLK